MQGDLETNGRTLGGEIQSNFTAAEGDFNEALELLEQRPNDELQYALLVNRGLLWFERREWNKAVADLEAAIRLNGAALAGIRVAGPSLCQARQTRSSRRAIHPGDRA